MEYNQIEGIDIMTIKELRNLTGLSQSKFAKLFNIPLNTLQRWEIDYRKPPGYVVYMITELLRYKGYIKDEDNTELWDGNKKSE